jgi:transmembrane sensor
MTDGELYELLQKFRKGTITPEEEILLNKWYLQGSEDEIYVQSPYANEEALQSGIFNRINQKSTRRIYFIRTVAAASILLITVLAIWLFNKPTDKIIVQSAPVPGTNKAMLKLADGSTLMLDSISNGKIADQNGATVMKNNNGQLEYINNNNSNGVAYNTMVTPRGGQYEIILPDGTKVWLNAASSITYPTVFTSSREVEIEGELYFDIAKDKSRPFVVRSKHQRVEVLGTQFNINAYTDEPQINTTLVEGAVRILAGEKNIILQPGEMGMVTMQPSAKINVAPANISRITAWKNGYFRFDNTSLSSFMRQLSRWYDVEVIYEGSVPDVTFNGGLKRTASFSSVIEFLEKQHIIVKQKGKQIIIMSK